MKRLTIIFITIICLTITSRAQNNIGINDDNSAPKASAMLDVYSTSKGLLIPRIALTSTIIAAPVTSPAASLLIYNTATAGDVTPGYYYWDGAKWVRLVASTDPAKNFNIVTKTANATLLKTENMVFASGNITLTFPAISSADDGLEITIKNIGIYTDLISITGGTGITIDNLQTVTLTRWKARTFIAKGGTWCFKEREVQRDNVLDVGPLTSFNTIAEVIAFLNLHITGPTVVRLGAGIYNISATQTINLPYPVTFEGVSYGETKIVANAGVSGTPLFICQTECHFKMLDFTAYANTTGNDGIRFTNSGTYHEIKDCAFKGFNKAILSSNNHPLLWIFEVAFTNCAGAAIEIADGTATGNSIKISECNFSQCAKGLHLLSGIGENLSLMNSTFSNTTSGTDIGILYAPTTFTLFNSMFITNNTWNNQGTFISGFDFTRTDGRDANAFLYTNIGMDDKNPRCRLTVTNNTTFATVVTAGTYVKPNWVNTSFYTCKWTVDNNKITYQPSNKKNVWAIITGNMSVKDAGRIVTIAIVKNGVTTTRYGETDLRVKDGNSPFQFSTVVYIPDLLKNDYLELYLTTNANGDEVTIRDIQWFTDTH